MKPWRLLTSGPKSAFYNMAVDMALLHSGYPTFRTYQWTTPTLSLGYFQPYTQTFKINVDESSIQIVRRMTGGGAIFHHQELTFSLILPFFAPLPKKVAPVYDFLNNIIITSFRSIGYEIYARGGIPDETDFFCYNRQNPYDLLWKHKKLIGGAQRRTAQTLLHHASIPQGPNRFSQEWNYLPDPQLEKRWVPEMCKTLEQTFQVPLEPSPLSSQELEKIAFWETEFQSESHLKRR